MTKKLEIISECCICRDWRNDKGHYFTPTKEQRVEVYKREQHYSHGMCEPCYLLWEQREIGELAKKQSSGEKK